MLNLNRFRFLLSMMLVLLQLFGCGGGSGTISKPNPQDPPPLQPLPETSPIIRWNDIQANANYGNNGNDRAALISIVDDGSGGVIIVWGDSFYETVWSQRISATGELLWGTGVQIYSPGEQASPTAISDGAGGAIVAWVDGRVGFCNLGFKASCDIYAQRVSPTGELLWGTYGAPVVTAQGNQGVGGIEMLPDGAGGAVLSWEDSRTSPTVYAQKLNPQGQPLWNVDGVRVGPEPTIVLGGFVQPRMISDNAGGAIIAWWNNQVDPDVGHEYLVAQRIDQTGKLLWSQPSAITSMTEIGYGFPFTMIADNLGGAIFITGHGIPSTGLPVSQLRASRINNSGLHLWGEKGVLISPSTGQNENPKAILDESGGAYVSWQVVRSADDKDIVVQRISSSGPVWKSPVLLSGSVGNQIGPGIFSDGSGGAFAVWSDCRNSATLNECLFASDIYGQRVNQLGQTYWKAGGFPLANAPGNQGLIYSWDWGPPPLVATRVEGGDYIFAWPDGRNEKCSHASGEYLDSRCDIYSMRIGLEAN